MPSTTSRIAPASPARMLIARSAPSDRRCPPASSRSTMRRSSTVTRVHTGRMVSSSTFSARCGAGETAGVGAGASGVGAAAVVGAAVFGVATAPAGPRERSESQRTTRRTTPTATAAHRTQGSRSKAAAFESRTGAAGACDQSGLRTDARSSSVTGSGVGRGASAGAGAGGGAGGRISSGARAALSAAWAAFIRFSMRNPRTNASNSSTAFARCWREDWIRSARRSSSSRAARSSNC